MHRYHPSVPPSWPSRWPRSLRLGGPSCLALRGDLLLVVASLFCLVLLPGLDNSPSSVGYVLNTIIDHHHHHQQQQQQKQQQQQQHWVALPTLCLYCCKCWNRRVAAWPTLSKLWWVAEVRREQFSPLMILLVTLYGLELMQWWSLPKDKTRHTEKNLGLKTGSLRFHKQSDLAWANLEVQFHWCVCI